ncbi:60S ribosomal protein L10-like [Suncus etruscus]|uniref:60S ribosomal protein L10-like n=1 Tax=Suncus etruscus TaxID=109475 RepID=UPI00210F45E6|nr:60S ribosomal protein L10-like [Suncus etruscus]
MGLGRFRGSEGPVWASWGGRSLRGGNLDRSGVRAPVIPSTRASGVKFTSSPGQNTDALNKHGGYLEAGKAQQFQTGMRGAFEKPQGTVARVHIGQVIMSICTKLQNKEPVIEALCRAKFKFPGRQKIHISKKWGFTKFNADEFEDMMAEKCLIPDGFGVKYIPNRGPLDKWHALHS